MPIHVYIHVNEDIVNELHIGRVQGGTDPDDTNDYLAVDGTRPTRLEDWHIDGVPFKHRYGDGLEKCVQRGMEALYGKVG